MVLLLLMIFGLFISVAIVRSPDEEKYFWVKAAILYSLCLIAFNIGPLSLPLGLAFGLYRVNKKSTVNVSLKKLALLFGLVYFVTIRFLPWIPVDMMLLYREIFAQVNRFDGVENLHVFNLDAEKGLTDTKAKYLPPGNGNRVMDGTILAFRGWVLHNEGIKIKNVEWLETVSMFELKFQDTYHVIDENTLEAYLDFESGQRYFALFKRDNKNSEWYLRLILEHGGVKGGQERRWPF